MSDNISSVVLEPSTSRRREWWGWLGCMVWMFFMMYGYDAILAPDWINESVSWPPIVFMGLFALSIAAFGWRFGRDPNGLSRIALYTTPAAIVITAVFIFLPPTLGAILYSLSPVLMASALVRRVYGVIHTAEPDRRLTRYMSGIAVCVALFTLWIILAPPKEIAFLVPALFAIPVWLGIRRGVTLPDEPPQVGAFKFSKRLLFLLLAAVTVLFWLNTMVAVVHTHIIIAGNETSEIIYTLLGFILPPVGFLLFGIISDKGHERTGFVCGMMLFLAGVIIAFLPVDTQTALVIPLAFTHGLGGAYPEFFILTIPVFFLVNTRRPVFAASLGVVLNLLSTALLYIEIWIPEVFLTLDTPLLVSTAITAIVFVVLVFFLFERHREKTLAAALYAILRIKETETSAFAEHGGAAMLEAGFTEQEKEIALLLIEGDTQRDISRKLHMNAVEVKGQINSIKDKVGVGEPDPVIAEIVKEYKLTKRETDMLRGIMRNMGNDEIAAEYCLSDETVRTHMRNLLKKLPLDNKNRANVKPWVESLKGKNA